MSSPLRNLHVFGLLMLTALGQSACLDNGGGGSTSASRAATTTQANTSTPGAQASGTRHTITDVSVTQGSGSNASYSTRVLFNTATPAITASCQNAADCQCQFAWDDVNNTAATPLAYRRTVRTPISTLQNHLLICAAPSVYAQEISESAPITFTVVPTPGSRASFSTNGFLFRKRALSAQFDFQDAEGRAYQNVFRYSCFDQFKKGLSLTLKQQTLTGLGSSGNQSARVSFQSGFCASRSGSPQPATEQCPASSTDNSAQSYYYNLYVRSAEVGVINAENANYRCPRVTQPLRGSSGSPNFYPLDSTFALSLQPSSEFPVGVEANSRLAIPGDPTSASSGCFASQGAASSETPPAAGEESAGLGALGPEGIQRSCLGFAAIPRTDGSCPTIGGRRTFRLRRYIIVYPPHFEADGKMREGPQPTDTIYVLDRPVGSVPGAALEQAPHTMLGPKPCPFAFAQRPLTPSEALSYRSTNASYWNTPRNVDGIRFPSFLSGSTANACAGMTPVWQPSTSGGGSYLQGNWRLGRFLAASQAGSDPLTELLRSRAAVRPFARWTPHYIEDTEFRACAPLPTPVVEAPLQVSPSGGYCARTYPTHNLAPGLSTPLEADGQNSLGTGRPARYPVTSTNAWALFPIQASDAAITQALGEAGSSYACTVSQDDGRGFAGNRAPSSGCCAVNGSVVLDPAQAGSPSCGIPGL